MSYPRTPSNEGEYAEPDGRIRISRERYGRLIAATGSAAVAQADLKAALDREFSVPPPRVSLSREALNTLAHLLVNEMGILAIAGAANPLAAANSLLRHNLDVVIVDD